ncbi:MotA/TolQ/ExbB proton channel family protein [Cerasicoccus fimbriatus]|uniref:MotA/TolQ/ExbB proton channel family protein n=1 Tax=Cerasicoccus fimbriatus TaxID=3014554 RepID=UPI0022B34AB9|nr:MotA/TolQ/ExbB proton channel family protein [Cerasicoccus sp. TK19100]
MADLSQWFLQEVWPVWEKGGWLMPFLALLALVIYYTAFELWRDASRWPLARLLKLSENDLTADKLPPELSRPLSAPTPADSARGFDSLRRHILQRLDRRMAFLAILTSAAPLAGLLGTVTGLLATFRQLALSSGGIAEGAASGLYEALISTQTGLIIAIPAYMALYALRRRRDEWAAAITHVESIGLRPMRKEAA